MNEHLFSQGCAYRFHCVFDADYEAGGELAVRVGKTPTSVSQHLAKLRMARMVHARQEGTRVFYSLVDEHAATLVVQAIYQAEHAIEGDPHPPRRWR